MPPHNRLAYFGAFRAGILWLHYARYSDKAKLTPEAFVLELEREQKLKRVQFPHRKETLWKLVKPLK